jgi:hypothetical protein
MDQFGGRIACVNFSTELLKAPPEVFRKALVLKDLCSTTNSYVRGPRGANRGKGLNDITGRVKMARDSGATEEEIRDAILRGITDPPNAILGRVEEVRRRFLS